MKAKKAADLTPDDDTATLAAFFEAHKDEESMWRPVNKKIRVRRGGPSHIFSVRFSAKEMERIDEAAYAQGVTMTELIRSAALAAAENGQVGALKEIEEKARELTEAVSKLRAS